MAIRFLSWRGVATRLVIAVMVALLSGLPAAQAEKRVALVIGNATYTYAVPLRNPKNDAKDLSAALERLGFETLVGVDLDKAGMDDILIRFARAARDTDVAMVYFSGHAVQFGGHNYLLPIDVKLADEADLRRTIKVDDIVGDLQQARTLSVLVLDSCRDNPLADELRRSIGLTRGPSLLKGLARIQKQQGMIVAYATQPGRTAEDGTGHNSPYTSALLRHIETPVEIGRMFRQVSADVYQTTSRKQLPELSLSIVNDYYFLERPSSGQTDAAAAWSAWAEKTTDITALRYFIRLYGDTNFGTLALARLDALKKNQSTMAVPLQGQSSGKSAALAFNERWVNKGYLPESLRSSPEPKVEVGKAIRPSQETHKGKPLGSLDDSAPVMYCDLPCLDAKLLKSGWLLCSPSDAAVARVTPAAKPASAANPCRAPVALASLSQRKVQPLSVAEECGLKAKDVFKECETCPEMVVVPAGGFMIGSPKSELGRENDEGPQHRVTIGAAFAVGRFAVTFEEWDACVSDGGCNGYRPKDQGWSRGRHPVITLSWNDARAYVRWIKKRTGKEYRLLSEAEWEYAARAGSTTPFWWGSSISSRQANYASYYTYGNELQGKYRGRTVPVGSFEPNQFGLYEVHGNAWQWTMDCYHDSYDGAPTDGSALITGDCSRRVLRGGSWDTSPSRLRAAERGRGNPSVRSYTVGFRLGRTLIQPSVKQRSEGSSKP